MTQEQQRTRISPSFLPLPWCATAIHAHGHK
jgi:hypothetical protein